MVSTFYHHRGLIYIFLIFGIVGCRESYTDTQRGWSVLLDNMGSSSSPRVADLDGDGVKDIVIGAGRAEFQSCDSAIIAVNGRNGDILWTASARDQIFNSVRFRDLNNDQVPEVIVGGRSATLMALDGSSGKRIWQYEVSTNVDQLFNFYIPQFVRDLDGDDLPDLVVSAGGDPRVLPGDTIRPPGNLMLISAKDGSLIARAEVPDQKETYMSVVVMNKDDQELVLFGTGGETIAGNFYLTDVASILNGDISQSLLLSSGQSKGFIAPPVLADITGDHQPDIVVSSVEGKTIAIDGQAFSTLWEFTLPGTEVYSSHTVGDFNQDQVPDFFTNYGIGEFPNFSKSIQVCINGLNGTIFRLDTLGTFHYSSGVAYDITGDGQDDVLFHINESVPGIVKNTLKLYDYSRDQITDFSPVFNGANLGSTPLIEDLDTDGMLDVIIVHENNPFDLFFRERNAGLFIRFLPSGFASSKPVRWGSYMGSNFNGMY